MNAASRLRARLARLTGRERLILALGAAAAVAIVAFRWALLPAVAEYRRARAAIPARRGLIARYEAVQAGQDNVAAALEASAKRLQALEEGLLPGSDPSAAGAYLQGLLKPMVGRPDTRLTSIRTLAPVARGGYAEVAVQMDLQTTTEGLASLLASLPRAQKILRVKKLTVTSPIYSATLVNRPDTLVVSVVVAGIGRAGGGATPDGGEG